MIHTEFFRSNSKACGQFLDYEYKEHPERYPDGVPSWAQVVDYIIENGKQRTVKIKFWIWIDRVYGAHTEWYHVVCVCLRYGDGLCIDRIMMECWPKAIKACNDPTIKVCNNHAILRCLSVLSHGHT